MITKETFTPEWIHSLKSRLGKGIDPKILEKVIYALYLLEQLRLHELNFIFKGGTCLLLTSKSPKRFSIDIDIITEQSEKEITSVLEKICDSGIFLRWETDNDRKSAIEAPVSHYKLFYNSVIDSRFGEEPILLDVLFSPSPYSQLNTHPISHHWLNQTGDHLSVQIPTYECILGDKLTAFAPNTTGILYKKGRPVEIIKQLHDLGLLYDLIADLNMVKESYHKIVKEELKYRKLNISAEEVLKDTFDTCLIIASRNEKLQEFNHMMTGIKNITNLLIERFKIDEAITAAGKVALVCVSLKNENLAEPVRYKSSDQITELSINHPDFMWLNKLKKSNPEGFFYWEKAMRKT